MPKVKRTVLRRGVLVPAVAGGALLGAAGYGAYRMRRTRSVNQEADVDKIYNPYTDEIVAVSKARYPVALPVQSSRPQRALVRTGRHMGQRTLETYGPGRSAGFANGLRSYGKSLDFGNHNVVGRNLLTTARAKRVR